MRMGELLNQRPRVAIAAVAAVIVLVVAVVSLQFSSAGPGQASGRGFFSTDDGKTLFVDDASNLPPFDHDGKPAVRAYVFECNGKRFVNHLERYTPDGRKAAEAAASSRRGGGGTPGTAALAGAEVKKPGAAQWTSLSDVTHAAAILRPKCPDGAGDPKPVEP